MGEHNTGQPEFWSEKVFIMKQNKPSGELIIPDHWGGLV